MLCCAVHRSRSRRRSWRCCLKSARSKTWRHGRRFAPSSTTTVAFRPLYKCHRVMRWYGSTSSPPSRTLRLPTIHWPDFYYCVVTLWMYNTIGCDTKCLTCIAQCDNNNNKARRILTKAALPSWHPSQRQMDSSDLDPYLIHGSMDQHESSSKRHLDRFSIYCRVYLCAQQSDKHTDRQTTLLATSIAIGRIYAMRAMWHNNNSKLRIYIAHSRVLRCAKIWRHLA